MELTEQQERDLDANDARAAFVHNAFTKSMAAHYEKLVARTQAALLDHALNSADPLVREMACKVVERSDILRALRTGKVMP